jgi:DNA repair protein RadD
MKLRPYQDDLYQAVQRAWAANHRDVLAVAPTGSGKTVLFSHAVAQEPGASVTIAHRQELVTQMSMALARNAVRHRVIGPANVMRACMALHVAELGRHFIDAAARSAVAGVDTLVRRDPQADQWFRQVQLVVCDEAHHLLSDNKWGKAAAMFPNARLLGVTATPVRADGKGLGAGADGVFDEMVEGPSMRWLIQQGYLTPYRVFAPKAADLDLQSVPTSAGGDYSPEKLRDAVHKSRRIVGDVVGHYLRLARGKLGVTFAVDVEAAREIAAEYNRQGVPAEVVTAETPDLLRAQVLRRFRNREVLQLVNVDLFGEGFDLPAIEVVSMARPTQSFSLYAQQFGRALRIMDGKEHAIIIDHVGNVLRHGLPDAPRSWSLDRREKRSTAASDLIPMRVCPECTSAYEAYRRACPYCGHIPVPAGRGAPEQVDGVLEELDPAVLARMRGEVEMLDNMVIPFGMPALGHNAHRQRLLQRNIEQHTLRHAMTVWGGWKTSQGLSDAEGQALFYFKYGIDLVSAWALGADDAKALRARIEDELNKEGVIAL